MDENSHDDEPPTAVTRPGPGAPTPPAANFKVASETLRVLLWLVRLGVTLALAPVLAYAGVLLAAFQLAGVALLLALVLLGAAATVWRRGMLPAAVLAAALTLPAAQVALGHTRFDRSFGTLTARPASPGQIDAEGYRRGIGPVLVDLRRFRAPDGSVTPIKAVTDNGQLVVALPRDRCFNLDIRYEAGGVDDGVAQLLRDGGDLLGVMQGAASNNYWSSVGLTERAAAEESTRTEAENAVADVRNPNRAYSLMLDGRYALGDGSVTRLVPGHPEAPTLRLDLRSNTQIVVRDYPDSTGPLGEYSGQQTGGRMWPEGIDPPLSPGERMDRLRAAVRTPENRSRWVTWEREMIAWSTAQAKRYAGACASRDQLRDRGVSFLTQPESLRLPGGRISTARGGPTTRHSPIPQKPTTGGRLLNVEVNGLGEVHVIGTVSDVVTGQDPTGANG